MEQSLFSQLNEYGESGMYPCHMPGHKRNPWGDLPEAIAKVDITEIEGFDNLHEAEGILRIAQERCNRLYGARESFFLVNGSSCGVMAAISGTVSFGGKLLIGRGAHKSAYHGMYLRHIEPVYLYGSMILDMDILEAISPEEVEASLDENPDVQAVFIVSPTYEGRIADIASIATIAHRRGIPLIVDEAHGSHLGFHPGFSSSAISCGADIVIHSAHKTLPAMTQTAMLHLQGDLVSSEAIRRFLQIYQTTSPSYVLMASLDNAMSFLEREGQRAFEEFVQNYQELLRELRVCKNLVFLSDGDGKQDIGKLIISMKPITGSVHMEGTAKSVCKGDCPGTFIARWLREKYRIETEMASWSYCIAMFTVGDTREGFERMKAALLALDAFLESEELGEKQLESVASLFSREREICSKLPFWQAIELEKREVSPAEAVGKLSAEFIYLYPPGAPVLVPGEVISKDVMQALEKYRGSGLHVQGMTENGQIRIVMEREE